MPGPVGRGFAERVALVTHGARGVGRAVALQLAFAGAYVIVSYERGDAEGEAVAGDLREMGTLAHAFPADVRSAADVAELFAAVAQVYGRLDLLVNVAGHTDQTNAALEDIGEDVWDQVIDRDLKGAFLCAQAAVPLMRGRPAAAIVNVATAAGVSGRYGSASQIAAHAGIIGLTRSLARELTPRVRVNCVAAGLGQGSLVASDEVARACLHLLSPEARLISGQTIVVGDGG